MQALAFWTTGVFRRFFESGAAQELANRSQNPASDSQNRDVLLAAGTKKMKAAIRSSGNSVRTTEEVMFKFQDLEITWNALVMRFLDEKTVIPLKEIRSYHLKWYLHDPTFAKKYWFLVLTVTLKSGKEESGPIAVAKFNYVNDEHELRQHITTNIVRAIDLALSWRGTVPRKINRDQEGRPRVATNHCN